MTLISSLHSALSRLRCFRRPSVAAKKKLLVVVGAGASIDFGLPSVRGVDKILDKSAAYSFPLASDPTSNLYTYARDMIQTYSAGSPKPAIHSWTNFEEIIYQLNLIAPYLADPHRLQGSNAFLRPNPLPDVLEFGVTAKPVDANVLQVLTARMVDDLVDHFIDKCASLSIDKRSELAELADFFALLRSEFEVGIVTLNYDDIIEQACPDLYTGFNTSTSWFEPLAVLTRIQWDFIYHLHGSIHFSMTGVGHDMHGITWATKTAKDHSVHSFGRNTQGSIEGTAYPMSPIVAGYGKTQQILRQPFRTFYAQANRLVHEADSLLFLGYGFGDVHLNAIFSEVRDRRRPTLVIDWAADDQDSIPFRHDAWTRNLFKTLPGNARDMSEPGRKSAAHVGDLKARHQVECSRDPDTPLAVYYAGLLEACRHIHGLLPYLR